MLWLTADFVWFRPRSRKREEREKRESYARSIAFRTDIHGVGTDTVRAEFTVKNSSPLPVDGVRLIVRNTNCEGEVSWDLGTLLPEEPLTSQRDFIPVDPRWTYRNDEAQVFFRDVWGTVWKRTPFDCTAVADVQYLYAR